MKASLVVKNELAHYKKNQLIFASKLYREKLSEAISEAAYYKILERMCKRNELAKVAKGIYYIPHVSKYGVVPPSDQEIVEAFTQNRTGAVIGYTLYNHLNLTTQVPKTVNVLSSALDAHTKTIRNVTVRQVALDYSEDVTHMIQGLDVLQSFYEIQDINYGAFIKYAEKIAEMYQNDVFETVVKETSYKKSTIAFLKEILNFHNVPNNLNQYLSALSNYKYPRMEELYEIARISRGI